MRPLRLLALTSLAMTAFAGNSILCRMALRNAGIDAATFTLIRIASGALMLWLIVRLRGNAPGNGGNWLSALALFGYAAGFSFAYVSLPTASGALLLFGAVQATMIGYGLWSGERLQFIQIFGLGLALTGLVALLMPGLSAPPIPGSTLMLGAGAAWGVYSLRGRSAEDPARATAGNFLRAVLPAAALGATRLHWNFQDGWAVAYAVCSGAFASGIGYIIWYSALPGMKATTAATVQLSVPILAAAGGILFLGEPLTLRFFLASAGVLGGVFLVITGWRQSYPVLQGD